MNNIQNTCCSNIFFNKLENNKNKKNISFQGLSKVFSKQIYVDPLILQVLFGVEKPQIAGNMPNEFICAISPEFSKKEAVKEIFNAFGLAINELRQAEKLGQEKRSLEDNVKKIIAIIPNTYGDDSTDASYSDDFLYGIDSLDKNTRNLYESNAVKHLEEVFKKFEIIPKDGKITMDYMASGAYGYTFNLSFLDKDNQKLFYDKTLKMYKNDKLPENHYMELAQAQTENFQEINVEEELEIYAKMPFIKELDEDLREMAIELRRQALEQRKKVNKDDMYANLIQQAELARKTNGVIPEANRALYIKKETCDMIHSNFVVPHFFDFKNKFGLFDTANEDLPAITKEIDFDDFNLIAPDISFNDNNTVCDRVVDYGGMIPITMGKLADIDKGNS